MTNVEELHKRSMRDPEYRKEYRRLAPEFQLAANMIRFRMLREKKEQADEFPQHQ